MDIIGLTR